MKREVRVFAPASVANVAVGFDILGFAIHGPGDEVVARLVPGQRGVSISAITGLSEGRTLPLDANKNTAGYAAQRLLQYLGKSSLGIDLEIHKKMPFGSGLGSSAASAVGGVMAVNELLGTPLAKEELLPFAVEGEEIADGAYHADNVAPSLLGGLILIRSNADLDVHSLQIPNDLHAAVVYPHVEILTKEARDVLSNAVPLKQVIAQTGNLAALIVGLYKEDYELVSRSLQDVIIEPQRARLIPCFHQVKASAMDNGALGCSISGAGPSVFAWGKGKKQTEKIGKSMLSQFHRANIGADLFVSKVNTDGAITL